LICFAVCFAGVKTLLRPEKNLPVREKELIPVRLSYFDQNDLHVSIDLPPGSMTRITNEILNNATAVCRYMTLLVAWGLVHF
jgi:hypothetical protein